MNPQPSTTTFKTRDILSPRKRIIQYTALFFAASFSLLSGVIYLVIQVNQDYGLKTSLQHEAAELNSAGKFITLLLEMRISDLMVLSEGETLRSFLHDDKMTNRVHLTREMMLLGRRKPYYTHIRLLDSEGNEILWIDNSMQQQRVAPRSKLRNKRESDDFQQTITLSEGDVYISQVDLKSDHEDFATPQVPTIRLATPVFDGYGVKRGIVVFNYAPNEMFDRVVSLSNPLLGQSMILNPQGYWLTGTPNHGQANFVPDKGYSFSSKNPETWKLLQEKEQGSVRGDEGIYVYQKSYLFHREHMVVSDKFSLETFTTNPHINDPYWILVSFISSSTLDRIKTERSTAAGAFYLALFFLTGLMSFTFASIIVQKQLATQQLRERAVTDDLTGTMNRRELSKVGKREFERARRFQRPFSIMMLDLDHFKNINDLFGHDIGDKVLRHVSVIIQSTIRLQDMLARYGGEEFSVLMPETDIEGAKQLAERICVNVNNQPYHHTGGDIEMTVSIGISSYTANDQEYQSILLRSDKALYIAKARGRNRCETAVGDT